MIKQDYQTALAQAAEREQRINEKKALAAAQEKEKAPRGGSWQVVAVQCIACAVILLLALFVRVGGGSAYTQLRQEFSDSLQSNDLLAALAQLWDGDPAAMLSSDPLEEEGELLPPESQPDA